MYVVKYFSLRSFEKAIGLGLLCKAGDRDGMANRNPLFHRDSTAKESEKRFVEFVRDRESGIRFRPAWLALAGTSCSCSQRNGEGAAERVLAK